MTQHRQHPANRPEPITLTSNGHTFTFNPCPPGCSCQGRLERPEPDELELTPVELIAEHTGRREYLEG